MTDNEIIKALECCIMDNVKDCDCCPYNEIQTKTYCANRLIKDALDIINRQKAEIERLRSNIKTDFFTVTEKLKLSQSEIGDIRAEAIKEFAEKLKEKAYLDGSVSIAQELVVDVRDIDDLVEEMTVNYESSKNGMQRKDEGK